MNYTHASSGSVIGRSFSLCTTEDPLKSIDCIRYAKTNHLLVFPKKSIKNKRKRSQVDSERKEIVQPSTTLSIYPYK